MPNNSSMVMGAGFALGSVADDVITGSSGDDRIYGVSGDDNVYAASGTDAVDTGDGDDLIVGGNGAGDDVYVVGAGKDTIKYTSARAGITVDLAAASNQARSTGKNAGIGTDQIMGVESVIASSYADKLYGDALANEVRAGKGNDRIDARSGSDRIFGGAGKDILIGGKGKDAFVFDAKPNTKSNLDKVSGFSA